MLYNTTGKGAIAAKPALDDPTTTAAIVDAANTWDMETGGPASRKAAIRKCVDSRDDVSDHRTVRTLGRDLAKKLNVTPTPPDRDFALYKQHVAAFDAVTTLLLPATKNAELRDLQTTVAANFQAHLADGKQIQSRLSSR